MWPRWVILKKGEHGCFVLGPDLMLAIPAYPSDRLIDPTGAGDSFAGGLLGHLCENMDSEVLGERSSVAIDRRVFVQAVKHGTAVASYTIESFSIERLQQINREDIQNRVAQIDLLMGHCG